MHASTEAGTFSGVRREAGDGLDSAASEVLFLSEGRSRYSDAVNANPVFQRWGLLRGTPRMRGHSGKPDLENPANLMLRLRDHYGNATRADVMTYLITADGGSSNAIASRLKYNQKGVYDALEQMYGSGFVHKYGGVNSAHYWLDRADLAPGLGLEGEPPAFFVWSDIYYSFFLAVSDYLENRKAYESDFLSIERMRDLTVKVVPLLRNAGQALSRLSVPDVKRQSGTEHKNNLVDYLIRVLDVLRESTLG